MKKILSVTLSTMMLMSGISTFAANDGITVELDGKTVEFDVKPEVVDGRTMVPLRKIFEEIGAMVKWDDETQTVSARKNSKTIKLSVDSTDLQIDKGKTDDEGNPIVETVTLEVPAQVVSGRTLVPARAISESFGLKVDWDEDNQKVIITSDDEEDDSWKENAGSINLSNLTCEGKGIEISGNQIKITEGGDFTVTGILKDGNITVSAKEKVKLRLNGVEITSSNNPCIFVEDADKAYITLTEGTENYLIANNSDDGAIYSKENLEIKGDGKLDIKSLAGHGIKASDNLTIESGNIIIDATSDGIHINDTFKMTGGTVDITAIGDGIDCESIVNISSGKINIETNGTPIESEKTAEETTQEPPRRGMWEMDEADVEFEKSTKGINAEWMMKISGGEINVNSASHAIHCQDEMEISGGTFTLSSKYDKGISAHGNLIISGEETSIDIAKSTEGIESKKVMTINDGVIKVISTDDAINATGGNGKMMPGGGNFGGNGNDENRKPPEGFTPPGQTTEGAQPGMRPKRGGNGRFGGIRPVFGNGENSEVVPPFGNNERGEMVPPADNKQNGEPMPPFGNGNFTPPFEMDENGEFVPPFRNRENGEAPNTDGNTPPMNQEGRFPGGFMGGMGRNMKECLIINGGYLELCGNDDCVDTNGNMTINGGTVKAANPNGAFTGNFGVLDADGQITIGENANVILAAGSGNSRGIGAKQNTLIVFCENSHEANEKITVSDSNGNVVCEFAPAGSFKSLLIASDSIKTGEKYSITIGNETFETEIAEQNTVLGTQTNAGNMGFGRGQRMQ